MFTNERDQTWKGNQWRIQDFPEVLEGQLPEGCQHTILRNVPKNCMKMKEFYPGGASLVPPLDPPLGMEFDQEKGGKFVNLLDYILNALPGHQSSHPKTKKKKKKLAPDENFTFPGPSKSKIGRCHKIFRAHYCIYASLTFVEFFDLLQ